MWKQKKKQPSEQNDKIAFNILRIYITIYHTYQLLYCKGHIQMRNNNNHKCGNKKNRGKK